MKNKMNLIYWGSTGLLSFMMLGSATMYFVSAEVAQNFTRLGFPDYFRVELGIAKYLGVLALLLPMTPQNVREWAYAGFGITMVSAAITHASVGDPVGEVIPPIIGFMILSVSYWCRQQLDSSKGPKS